MNCIPTYFSEGIRLKKERYIVTSALPYINGVKHLGNLIGSLLPADVYARYLRLKGKDVVAVCGTDDHGTPAEISAAEAGLPVDEFCQQQYEIQKDIYERFHLSFDYFGKTSTQENTEITQDIFLKLYQNGYIFEKENEQLFSIEDDRYLPDRYVIGTCPHCGYEKARGDQCEGCTTLLNPIELINPRSALSGSDKIEIRKTKHLYLDLPKLQPKVEEWVNMQEQWPNTTKSIAKKWLREGLKPRGITRNLKWGIPVPLEGYEDLVFYVWFDAPIGYLSITKQWGEQQGNPELWKEYWKNEDTTLIQFMGIDNVPFHTVTWPSSLIGANDGYIKAKHVKGFQWLTYESGKFSTSQSRGVFTDQALELYPADYWRYYLLLIAPERQDTDFLWEGFQNAVNHDLNNLLGNLVNRAVTFTTKHFDGKVPKVAAEGALETQVWDAFAATLAEYDRTFVAIEFQKPLKTIRGFLQEANKYFQESTPWVVIKEDKEQAGTIVGTLVHIIRSVSVLLTPFIPETAEKIFGILGIEQSIHSVLWDDIVDHHCIENNTIHPQGNLFTKIENKEIEQLKEQFGSKTEAESTKQKAKDEKQKRKAKKMNEKKVNKKVKSEQDDKPKRIKYDDFTKMVLKSAVILEAKPHPNADRLLVLTLDDGERKDRTLVAGIANSYKPKDLIGTNIIIVDNLKPKKLRGIKSEGMLLAVEDENGISVLRPDRLVSAGIRVY